MSPATRILWWKNTALRTVCEGSFLGNMAATAVALVALDKPPYNPFSEAVLELLLKLQSKNISYHWVAKPALSHAGGS